jgi:hypothetical protein
LPPFTWRSKRKIQNSTRLVEIQKIKNDLLRVRKNIFEANFRMPKQDQMKITTSINRAIKEEKKLKPNNVIAYVQMHRKCELWFEYKIYSLGTSEGNNVVVILRGDTPSNQEVWDNA